MDSIYDTIVHLQEHGDQAVLVTVVEVVGSAPCRPGHKMLVDAQGDIRGTVGGGALEWLAIEAALETLTRRQNQLIRYSLTDDDATAASGDLTPSPMVCGGQVALFYEYVGGGPTVYVFGAGHIGRALALVLANLPYRVVAIDHRPETGDAVPGADRVIIAPYETALDDETVPAGSYFVIATPDHQYDYVTLRRVMTSPWRPAYVGMIGSRNKVSAQLARLRDETAKVPELAERIDWDALYSPIGLRIGGPTPAEIALSIAAEMQAVAYGVHDQMHMRINPHAPEHEEAP